MTCKDCIHQKICKDFFGVDGPLLNSENADIFCTGFKNKHNFIELQCKVYLVPPESNNIYYVNIGGIHLTFSNGYGLSLDSSEIGKTVFLTKEEAEAALNKETKNG